MKYFSVLCSQSYTDSSKKAKKNWFKPGFVKKNEEGYMYLTMYHLPNVAFFLVEESDEKKQNYSVLSKRSFKTKEGEEKDSWFKAGYVKPGKDDSMHLTFFFQPNVTYLIVPQKENEIEKPKESMENTEQ